eukprot:TRINITY_DN12547_c0_g1_i1.p1 TRINITY_DN12547_c0_g1~~TRINITY_DN12547_c0_g1_i1.p1  ORF type:complete len:607 (+),score=122.66 TRINITY_DN12547_c0_g1_i1:99-1919(+)
MDSQDASCVACGTESPPNEQDGILVCSGCGIVVEEDSLISAPMMSFSRGGAAAPTESQNVQVSDLLCKKLKVDPKRIVNESTKDTKQYTMKQRLKSLATKLNLTDTNGIYSNRALYLIPRLLGHTAAPKGWNADVFYHALLLVVSREQKVGLTAVEVARKADVPPHKFQWWIRTIVNHLKRTGTYEMKEPLQLLGEQKSAIISRYCRDIVNPTGADNYALEMKVAATSTSLVNFMDARGIATGRNPLAVIAAAINLAASIHIRDKDILDLVEISNISRRVNMAPNTVKSRLDDLINLLNKTSTGARMGIFYQNDLSQNWAQLKGIVEADIVAYARAQSNDTSKSKPSPSEPTPTSRGSANIRSRAPNQKNIPTPRSSLPVPPMPKISIRRPKTAFEKSTELRQSRLAKISQALERLISCPAATDVLLKQFREAKEEVVRLQGGAPQAPPAPSSRAGKKKKKAKVRCPFLSPQDFLIEELLIAGVSPNVMCDAPNLEALRADTPLKAALYKAILKIEEGRSQSELTAVTAFWTEDDPDFDFGGTYTEDSSTAVKHSERPSKRRKIQENWADEDLEDYIPVVEKRTRRKLRCRRPAKKRARMEALKRG